jgi:hypothetical protein
MHPCRHCRVGFAALVATAFMTLGTTNVSGQQRIVAADSAAALRGFVSAPCFDVCHAGVAAECVSRAPSLSSSLWISTGVVQHCACGVQCSKGSDPSVNLPGIPYAAVPSLESTRFGYGGAAFGALLGAAVGAVAGYALCQSQDDIMVCLPVLPIAGGAIAGAVIGGLIDR